MSEYIYEHKQSGCDVFGNPVSLPTLVRREEIVRCMDCKFYDEDDGYGNYGCTLLDFGTWDMPDGFCAWGERKEVKR